MRHPHDIGFFLSTFILWFQLFPLTQYINFSFLFLSFDISWFRFHGFVVYDLSLVVYIFTIVENETVVVEIVGDDEYIYDTNMNLTTSLLNAESIHWNVTLP